MHLSHLSASAPAPGLATGTQTVVQPRLVNAAHEFEAQLMKELMKPLTSGVAPGDDSDDAGGDSSSAGSTGALGEFASEAFARALSNQGGFGIANQIIGQLAQRGASKAASSPEISGSETESMRAIGNGRAKSTLKPLR